ncbi:TPA: hypothetical protein NGT97_001367 [Vibrio parahaemolyticus]|nr:hypothetical protein [Vibrio parahaemolyticus]
MEITRFDCSVIAIQGAVKCVESRLPLSHFVSPSLNKFFDEKSDCIRLKGSHPIEALKDYGLKIQKRNFKVDEIEKFRAYILDAKGIVVQHSYASLLRGRGFAKRDFVKDVQHMFFCNELNIKNNNVIFKPKDPILSILAWKHLFFRDDDDISVYKIYGFDESKCNEMVALNKAKEDLSKFDLFQSSSTNEKIIAAFEKAIDEKKEPVLADWINGLRKLFLTRYWFWCLMLTYFKANKSMFQLQQVVQKYKRLLRNYTESVSEKKYDDLEVYLLQLKEILSEELIMTLSIKELVLTK